MKAAANDTHETDQHLTGKDAITKARALLPSFRTGMLVTKSADNGELHMRPMALQGDRSTFGGTLWFFADDRSHKITEIERDPRVFLVFQNDLHRQRRGVRP